MSEQSYLLGVDVGTTTTKVGVFDPGGNLKSFHQAPTPTNRMQKGWAQHDVDELWTFTADLIRSAVVDLPADVRVASVCFATVGEAGVLVDDDGDALYPMIAWFDSRTKKQANWWDREFGQEQIFQITGMPLDHYYGVNKLLWIRDQHPNIFQRARYWLSMADLFIHRLCGVFVTDQTLASRTMLFDQRSRTWSTEMLAAANLNPELFPPALTSGTQVGEVTPQAADFTGLRSGTPVVLGGHDHLCGAYVVRQSSAIPVDSTGTAEVILVSADSFLPRRPPGGGYIYCYADVEPDRFVYSARIGYAGALVEWLRREVLQRKALFPDEGTDYSSLLDQIPKPLDFSGLICYPTFGRVISPNWASDEILGGLLGLTLDHHIGHIFQSILEGTGFSLRENIETIESILGKSLDRFRAVGGALKNPIWMQLKADITGREVEAVEMEEATVLGAAILGGVGAGIYSNHQEATRSITVDKQIWRPDRERQATYDKVYRNVYKQTASQLSLLNQAISLVSKN